MANTSNDKAKREGRADEKAVLRCCDFMLVSFLAGLKSRQGYKWTMSTA